MFIGQSRGRPERQKRTGHKRRERKREKLGEKSLSTLSYAEKKYYKY